MFQTLPTDVEQTGSLWAEHPFVAIGCRIVDRDLSHIQWENSQTLDGIHEDLGSLSMGDFADSPQIDAMAGCITDPAQTDESGCRVYGLVELIQVDGAVGSRIDFTDRYTSGLQSEPREEVAGKLVARENDAVAGFPGVGQGNRLDSERGVGDQSDFIGVSTQKPSALRSQVGSSSGP